MPADFIEGDTGSTLKVIVNDNASSIPIALTGGTVQFIYRIDNGSLTTASMTINADQSLFKGVATYQFGSGELTKGNMVGNIKYTDSAGKILNSLQRLTFQIDAPVS